MANLYNDGKSLLVRLRLVDRERAPRAASAGSTAPAGRFLAQAAVEHFDQKDGGWWPLLRLPALWLAPGEPGELLQSLERLIRGDEQGFAWHGAVDALALQLQRRDDGRTVVEAGADLASFLSAHSGTGASPGESLALFRLVTTQAGLVAFAGELRSELQALQA